MMYKTTIASLFIYALVNCSQLDIVSVPKNIIVLVPKEILHKILKIDILNEKMYEWTEYTRCHEMINDQSFGKFFIEEEREKGYYFSALKTATLFSMVNKGFYLQLALHIEPYKNWLSIALKNDIYENLKVGKQLTLTGSCDMYAMLKSGGNLEYYLNNKALIKSVGDTDKENFILKEYLPSLLLIRDHITEGIIKQCPGAFIHIYDTLVLRWILQSAFERNSNNSVVLCTTEPIETYPHLIHKYLEISVRLLEEKDGLFYYKINKNFNAGFFLTKDSNKACVIS